MDSCQCQQSRRAWAELCSRAGPCAAAASSLYALRGGVTASQAVDGAGAAASVLAAPGSRFARTSGAASVPAATAGERLPLRAAGGGSFEAARAALLVLCGVRRAPGGVGIRLTKPSGLGCTALR